MIRLFSMKGDTPLPPFVYGFYGYELLGSTLIIAWSASTKTPNGKRQPDRASLLFCHGGRISVLGLFFREICTLPFPGPAGSLFVAAPTDCSVILLSRMYSRSVASR